MAGGVSNQPTHWFEELADHMGPAYLRYSFTRGTENEVAFLVEHLGLKPGDRVLDVGCGPGRHAHVLARQGIEVLGVDISQRFVDLGNAANVTGATFVRGDARALTFDAQFDAVISLCQGAFGLSGGPSTPSTDLAPELDLPVLQGMSAAVRPGGRVAFSAFSAYFQLRWLEDGDRFDAVSGVNCETTEVRDENGSERTVELWTTCFTPRELRLLCDRVSLDIDELHSVTPGDYRPCAPTIDTPEFLVLATRPL